MLLNIKHARGDDKKYNVLQSGGRYYDVSCHVSVLFIILSQRHQFF